VEGSIPISDVADSRLEDAVAAVREFIQDQGRVPTAASWTEAEMRPSEKTIRRHFGGFKADARRSQEER
jgi:hypothetical protein